MFQGTTNFPNIDETGNREKGYSLDPDSTWDATATATATVGEGGSLGIGP